MTPPPQIYLSFNGNCEAALRFYAQRLGAVPGPMFTYDSMPLGGELPAGWQTKIMHGSITLGGVTISGADVTPDRYEQPKGFRIFLDAENLTETEQLFHALVENATIEMPLQQTSWSVRFGTLTDQFGIPWTIGCAQLPDSEGK